MSEFGFNETASIQSCPDREKVIQIVRAALDAVNPYNSVRRIAAVDENVLSIQGQLYDLARYNRIFVVGAGKAAFPMAKALQDLFGLRVTDGAVIVKDGYLPVETEAVELEKVRVYSASHPIPDQRGINATNEILDLARLAGAGDLVVCVISGGGSALLTSPVEGIALDELQLLTGLMIKSGATINEINTLRKHLDRVKGGGLAQIANPAEMITLVLSDVVGDPLDAIASGPTVPDPSRFQDCIEILERYELLDSIPYAIGAHLRRGLHGEIQETLKPGDPIFNHVHTFVVASSYQAAHAAKQTAIQLGFSSMILTTFLEGEAHQVGKMLAGVLKQIAKTGEPLKRPACMIAGGETTVAVRGDGHGGRNLELALSSVSELEGLADVMLLTLATDGGDGPTDAAGGAVTGETYAQVLRIGLDPQDYLNRNDSYRFFDKIGDLIKTGPTQTNVNDLVFLFAF